MLDDEVKLCFKDRDAYKMFAMFGDINDILQSIFDVFHFGHKAMDVAPYLDVRMETCIPL